MKTLNTDEEVPEIFYIFLHSKRMWHLKWNFRLTKTLTSASVANTFFDMISLSKFMAGTVDYIPFIPNPNVDMHSPSSFSMREVAEYTVDYNAELHRKQHEETKRYPSRFGCIFAFGSIEEAERAANDWNFSMSDLKKFKLNTAAPTRVVKVNMQIISQMWSIGNGAAFNQEDQGAIWDHYWKGGGEFPLDVPNLQTGVGRQTINNGVIWEYLIDGQLEYVEDHA